MVEYLYYSATTAAMELGQTSDGPREVQTYVVVCDADSGKVYRATEVSSKPDASKPQDIQLLGEVAEKNKLVYFETLSGRVPDSLLMKNMQFSGLSDDDQARVLRARDEWYSKPAPGNVMTLGCGTR